MIVAAYRARMYARRAAAAGLTVEEWHARNAATQRRLDEINLLRRDHDLQLAVIAQHAARHDRRFTRHGAQS